jgi:hypothetical protein
MGIAFEKRSYVTTMIPNTNQAGLTNTLCNRHGILKPGEKGKDGPDEAQLGHMIKSLSALTSIKIPADELMACTNIGHSLHLSRGLNRRPALH